MSVAINPQTGWPVKPPKISRHWYVVWNAYCDSKSCIEANTQEELDAKYEKGRDCGLYGSIYEGGTRQGYDPEALAEYNAAWQKISMYSCVMPPAEDLRLTSAAKQLPAERYGEIHPELGKFKQTRERLYQIRNAKRNEIFSRAHSSPHQSTP